MYLLKSAHARAQTVGFNAGVKETFHRRRRQCLKCKINSTKIQRCSSWSGAVIVMIGQ